MMQKQKPLPGQESVWDYPRPPRLEATAKRIRIELDGVELANTIGAMRILETSHPPVYYLPPGDVDMTRLSKNNHQTFCEFKGIATYWSIATANRTLVNVAWSYANPSDEYWQLKNFLAFYPSKVTACYVDDKLVEAQPGDFYGGWITDDIVGPFKGTPGTQGW